MRSEYGRTLGVQWVLEGQIPKLRDVPVEKKRLDIQLNIQQDIVVNYITSVGWKQCLVGSRHAQ